MIVNDVIAALDAMAPFSKAAGWDVVGLQLGDAASEVTRAAVCHDVTDDDIARLEGSGVDLVVSYHPLLFEPVRRLTAGATPAGRAMELLRHGRALVVVHTAFDVAPGGAADALADAVALGNVSGFAPLWSADTVKVVTYVPGPQRVTVMRAMAAAGAGVIGNYTGCAFHVEGTGSFTAGAGADPTIGEVGAATTADEVRLEMNAPAADVGAVAAALVASHPYEEPAFDVFERRGDAGMVGRVGELSAPQSLGEFAATVTEALGMPPKVAGDRGRPVQRVAVVPGSGSDFFVDAAAAGADVVVTGDVSHHRAIAALGKGLAVVDAGHAGTERPGVQRLYAAVADLVEAIDLTGDGAGPWS